MELEVNYVQAVNLVMNESSNLDSKLKQFISNFELSIKLRTILTKLHTYNTATNLSTTNLLVFSIHSLSTAVPIYLSATALNNISTITNFNTAIKPSSDNIREFQIKVSPTNYWDHDSRIQEPEDTTPNTLEFNQWEALTSNILPAIITENELLNTIFSFELEELEVTLEEKPITAMYTDTKVDGHSIKLILDSKSAGSIITRQLMNQLGLTKTLISEIDNFSIEVNNIIVPIKVLVMEATQYQALITTNDKPLIELEEKKKTYLESVPSFLDQHQIQQATIKKEKEEDTPEEDVTAEEITSGWEREYSHELIKKPPYIPLKYYWMKTYYYCKPCYCKCYSYPKRQGKWNNEPCFACGKQLLDKGMWNNIPMISCLNGYPYDKDKIWQMANAKVERAMPNKILKIKNNPPEPVNIILIPNPNAFLDIKTGPEEFHKHYQNLTPTREEQEQWLKEMNTRLCNYCLIPCDFQYCNESDVIYNSPICMIYIIPEKNQPINNCASELKSIFNFNLNSDNNDDKNNDSSSQYIALPDLTKNQELKWFSNNDESIMPEQVHDTNTEISREGCHQIGTTFVLLPVEF
ncbi:hypothetical protein G9A89_004785 [Geosiphon pyriformis]|nr:hypothetical protein G9A89_004785 [Geosiphon pyriformis]